MGIAVDHKQMNISNSTIGQYNKSNIFYLNSAMKNLLAVSNPYVLMVASTQVAPNGTSINLLSIWPNTGVHAENWQSSQRKNMQYRPENNFKKIKWKYFLNNSIFWLYPSPFCQDLYRAQVSVTTFSKFFLWILTLKSICLQHIIAADFMVYILAEHLIQIILTLYIQIFIFSVTKCSKL